MKLLLFFLCFFSVALTQDDAINALPTSPVKADIIEEHSIARTWNEMLLVAIRNDLARPTVHARNLFHSSALMYDLWQEFEDDAARPYLLGETLNDFDCTFKGFTGERSDAALREAVSYGMYALLRHRFSETYEVSTGLEWFMNDLGYDPYAALTEDPTISAAALGRYAAQCYIAYGGQDGSNEDVFFANQTYLPSNEGFDPSLPGNATLLDPNRWQPLIFEGGFVDQSGNAFETPGAIDFLGAEWGQVKPFALSQEDMKKVGRDGQDQLVYHDPGAPPYLGKDAEENQAYLWNFLSVVAFSGQLDDEQLIDISPASSGNINFNTLPETQEDFEAFYSLNGGMLGSGYKVNPVTGRRYKPQQVPLGDYTRVLAEFWADGPNSETPPGHWFTILNYVSDQPEFAAKLGGEGEVLEALEWDIKAYFTLGGALHDAAVSAWGIKGAYDYPRPVSVIRYLAQKGQSSDPNLPNYDVQGLPLVEGVSELVEADDPLAGDAGEHVGKVKLWAWRGPEYIQDPATDEAGVGWILAETWWPYQRPSFVTPPFAGYVSGHSVFSRVAAEVLTELTGSPYFPGGLGEFVAEKNEFLVFEEGPSVDVVLQWASYADAADQTSLSRIWGGIHPPVDDIAGRRIGRVVAEDAIELALEYFEK